MTHRHVVQSVSNKHTKHFILSTAQFQGNIAVYKTVGNKVVTDTGRLRCSVANHSKTNVCAFALIGKLAVSCYCWLLINV